MWSEPTELDISLELEVIEHVKNHRRADKAADKLRLSEDLYHLAQVELAHGNDIIPIIRHARRLFSAACRKIYKIG